MKWQEINTKKDLKSVKAIFNNEPSEEASDRYQIVKTSRVLEVAEEMGWNPVAAAATANNKYGFHMVKLEAPKAVTAAGDKLQIIVSNSHDRTKAFKLDAGVFRFVCSNGLVIPTEEIATVEQLHMNFNYRVLYRQIREAVASLNTVKETVANMRDFDLSADQAESLAYDALLCRLGEEELVKDIDLDMFLAPRRRSDMGHDLWRTFNVVQEKIIGGHFTYKSKNKKGEIVDRKGREINHFEEDVRINKELFSLATAVMS